MPNFKSYDYNQSAMVVINYQDQLQAGTFEHAVHYLVSERMDLSAVTPSIKMILAVVLRTIQLFFLK